MERFSSLKEILLFSSCYLTAIYLLQRWFLLCYFTHPFFQASSDRADSWSVDLLIWIRTFSYLHEIQHTKFALEWVSKYPTYEGLIRLWIAQIFKVPFSVKDPAILLIANKWAIRRIICEENINYLIWLNMLILSFFRLQWQRIF